MSAASTSDEFIALATALGVAPDALLARVLRW